MKLLATDDPLYAIEEMIAADVFAYIVAEIDPEAVQVLAPLMLREEAHGITPDPVRRLVGLLPKDADKAAEIAKSLRMSKKLQRAVEIRLSLPRSSRAKSRDGGNDAEVSRLRSTRTDDALDPQNIRALAYRTSVEASRDIALLFAEDADLPAMLEEIRDW